MKKITLALLALLMCLVMFGCKEKEPPVEEDTTIVYTTGNMNDIQSDVQKEFDALQKKWFKEDMESDYVNMHFSVEDPAKMGLTIPEVTLGEVESDEEDTTYEDRLKELAKFKFADLTPDQKIMYRCMKFYYQLLVDSGKIEDDYTFVFTPNSGLNNNLITNFTEFDIRSEQDAKDLIVLVKDSGRYIDECIKYTKDQAEKGIIQPDSVIESIIDQCKKYISKVDDNEVIKVYNARIDEAGYADGETLKAEMAEAVKNYLIPGFQRIIEMYEGLKGKGTKSGLLAEYGDAGKATYEILVRNKVSTSESIEDLIKKMELAIRDVYNEIVRLYVEETEDYGYTELEDILKHLSECMVEDFPPMPTVSYKVAYLDPTVTSENVSAYYLIAPIDNINNNVIKVNPTFVERDINGLCITLAHEGFPGHLFQHTYYFANHPDNELRSSLSFIGYAEGWAQYVETYAYNYFLNNKKEVEYMQYNNIFSYCMYAYADLQIHYNGWSVDDLTDYFSQYFYESAARENAEAIYDTVIGDPGMFLPYSVGLYKMWKMYTDTKETLGKKFDFKAYNKMILDAGECPLDVLEEQVAAFVEKNK